MKVTLIHVPLPSALLIPEIFDSGLRYMPLNLAYLGAVLENANHKTNIIDLNIEMISVEDFYKNRIQSLDAEIIGLSCTTNSYLECCKLAESLKKTYPEVTIIVGGCHVTFLAEESLKECTAFDYVVRGEAEKIIVELIEAIEKKREISQVRGISYRDHTGQILSNQDAEIIHDLDSLPFPARHLLSQYQYQDQGIVSSRGCPRQCIFCSAGAMSKGCYRIRSAENIVEELKTLPYTKSIFFYDNTFSTMINKSKEICNLIIKEELNIQWEVELRADTVTREFIALLKKAGCQTVQFGVESGNGEILKEIKKHITKDQVRTAVLLCMEQGIDVACSFTIGHPSETEDTINDTLEFIIELQELGCAIFPGIITPYPGTELFNKKEELGITIHHYDWSKYTPLNICISTRYLTREKIGELYLNMIRKIDPNRLAGGVS